MVTKNKLTSSLGELAAKRKNTPDLMNAHKELMVMVSQCLDIGQETADIRLAFIDKHKLERMASSLDGNSSDQEGKPATSIYQMSYAELEAIARGHKAK
jgi:hypothetical protein